MKQVERMCFSGSLQQNSSGCSARFVDIWKSKSKTVVSAIARVRASKHAQLSEKINTAGMEFTSRIDTLKRRVASTRDLFAHQRHCPESYIFCCVYKTVRATKVNERKQTQKTSLSGGATNVRRAESSKQRK
jgi:hypothetical protein